MKKIVTFGEIMMRLSPPGRLRFGQSRTFDVVYGGGESNVAVSLANFGLPTEFVSCLPNNALGDACLQFLRQYNVGVNHILRKGERIGIYFLEHGSNMRPSQVIYDRANSSFAAMQPGDMDWKTIFKDAAWFHCTGITPAISEKTAAICLEGVKIAHASGLTVSCDMNFRAKLWKWGRNVGEVMHELLKFCDVAIGNEEDAEKVFGIKAPSSDILSGQVEANSYTYVCDQLAKLFPNLKTIAITLRGSISADHNTWSAILWNSDKVFSAPIYDVARIVDRVGGGDSFMGALIYALTNYPDDYQKSINFAVAASALKHTIFGDFNLVTVAEVEKLIKGDGSGRISR